MVSVFHWEKKDKMKIVYITPCYLPHIGGIEKYVQSLALYFKEVGNKVCVITAVQDKNDLQIEYNDRIRILRVPVRSFSGILYIKKRKFLRIIDEELRGSDIVHLNDCKFLYRYLAKRKKYKLFLSSHGFIFHTADYRFLKQIFFKKIIARYSKDYDRIICVSQQDADIAKEYGLKNISIVFPGVDIHKFECEEKKQVVGFRHLFYWGRIARNKGIAECLRKLAALKNFDCKFAGACEDELYMQELKSIIKENNLQKCVHFIGSKNDSEIKELINECDCILMPSLSEGFGMTLVECLLSRRNIIANINPSFVRILNDSGATEFLFNFIDTNTNLENKLIELETKKILPINVEQFSLETMFGKISDIYNI